MDDNPPPPRAPSGIRIAIDRGGTFTDCLAIVPGRPDVLVKLLSHDPSNYADAPTEAVRRVLQQVTGTPNGSGSSKEPVDTRGLVESIKMGTTVATNALLERAGQPCALVVTRGFRDLLRIGDQTRPRLFDLDIRRPGTLFSDVVEVRERVTPRHASEDPASPPGEPGREEEEALGLRKGVGGEDVRVVQELGTNPFLPFVFFFFSF